MREIQAKAVTETVSLLCQDANFDLGQDVIAALKKARDTDKSEVAKQVLEQILKNAEIAKSERIPLCQDCGAAVVFVDLGQDGATFTKPLKRASARDTKRGICANRWPNSPSQPG